jgi:tetratricopeptide (TPR) repeat protein
MQTRRVATFWFVWALGVNSCATVPLFQSAQSSFETGLALFNQGNFREAIPYFQTATERDANFAPAYFYLGRSLISTRRWREAIQPLRTAYRLAPEATRQEVFDILMDALFAVAISGFAPDRVGPSAEPLKDIL